MELKLRATVDSFLIKSASGVGLLEFLNRSPSDRRQAIEGFSVRISDLNLSAVADAYAGYMHAHPASLFVEMAQNWRGWANELQWGSLEGELTLRCRRDRLGHISIHVDLRAGPMESDWFAQATVMAEAGQLETMSRAAAAFFGQPGDQQT